MDPLLPGTTVWLVLSRWLGRNHQQYAAALVALAAIGRTLSLARYSSRFGMQLMAAGCVLEAARPVLAMVWAVILAVGVLVNLATAILMSPSAHAQETSKCQTRGPACMDGAGVAKSNESECALQTPTESNGSASDTNMDVWPPASQTSPLPPFPLAGPQSVSSRGAC